MEFSGDFKSRKIFGLCVLLLAAGLRGAAPPQRLYLGTYTGRDSEGIYTATFDPATGSIGPVELAAKIDHPSFLAVDSSGRSFMR
jgi:6-phosphogluconolactonase